MAEPDGAETGSRPGDDSKSTFWTRFAQQRLKAWQPVLAPRWVITLYLACGAAFLGAGLLFLIASWSVVEYSYDYSHIEPTCPEGWPREECTNAARTGSFEIQVERDMEPPIWIYYQLEGFHQNHRRYVKSKEGKQMVEGADVFYSDMDLPECKPWVYTCDAPSEDGAACPETHRRVNYPCGLIARSVFNDSFMVLTTGPGESDSWTRLPSDSRKRTIAWKADAEGGKFSNIDPEHRMHGGLQNQALLNMWIAKVFPPVACEQINFSGGQPYVPVDIAVRAAVRSEFHGAPARSVEVLHCDGIASLAPSCNFVRNGTSFSCEGPDYEVRRQEDWGVESGHLAVWMRIAGLPTFRKLYARVEQKIFAGSRLKVYVRDNFPVLPFKGRKAFVISTSSVLGGRNDFLGYGYAAVGCCCILFGLIFAWRHLTRPRPMGDITLLAGSRPQ